MAYRTLACACIFLFIGAATTMAGQSDNEFFHSVAGKWKGPGKIVAGKYKGTKFVCNFVGGPPETSKVGIALDGSCRVGVFSQRMSAAINQQRGNYSGHFMDGAKGKGLDVVSGQISGNKIVVGLNRKKLDGAMVAHLTDKDQMNITISVRVQGVLVPVIGMELSRDSRVGSIEMDR